jgi:hypothetical protein
MSQFMLQAKHGARPFFFFFFFFFFLAGGFGRNDGRMAL